MNTLFSLSLNQIDDDADEDIYRPDDQGRVQSDAFTAFPSFTVIVIRIGKVVVNAFFEKTNDPF